MTESVVAVDTQVPFGNAADVRVGRQKGETTVHFAADPHGGPECLWFCFRVTLPEGAPDTRIKLLLTNVETMLGGDPIEALRPVLRRADGDWERLDPATVEVQPDGRRYAVWWLTDAAPHADVAVCYPYGPEERDALPRECAGLRADTIGVSQGGRPLVRLSNDAGQDGGDRPGVYLIARQHSGETPGTWVLDGLLRRMAAIDDAPLVWAVPLTNIDGVMQGDYGKDNFPHDLNRAWGRPPMRHETLVLMRDAGRWATRCTPRLFLDFHAPGYGETPGLYAFAPKKRQLEKAMAESLGRWAGVLSEALGPLAADPFLRFAEYPSRWETPTSVCYFTEQWRIPAMAVECPYASAGERLLTREAYREAGAALADAIARGLGS